MKKLLSLLCVLTIGGTTMQTVIAASSYEKNDIENCKRKKRESNDKFLPKLIKNTKLGKIPTNSEENILDQVVRLNRNINRNDITINRLLNNQAQIVLRETLENNSFPENNFIWVTFETDPDIEIQVGNSIFYNLNPVTSNSNKNNYSYVLFDNRNNFNLGIIPDNRGTTIIQYIINNFPGFLDIIEPWTDVVLENITYSTATLLTSTFGRNDAQILVTFTPQRIDLNSIITITDLGRINKLNVIERIFNLYPQLRNTNIYVKFISLTSARIFVSDDDPLYFGSVSVSFENNVGDKETQKEENKKNDDSDSNEKDTKINLLVWPNEHNKGSIKPSKSTLLKESDKEAQIANLNKKNNPSVILKNLNLNWDITGPITNDKKIESKKINLIKWSDYANSLKEFKEKYKHIKFNDFSASAGGQGTTISKKTNIEFNTQKIGDKQIYKEIIKYDFLNFVPMIFINYVEQFASLYINNLFFEGEYLKARIISYTYSWMAIYHVWTKMKIGSVEFY